MATTTRDLNAGIQCVLDLVSLVHISEQLDKTGAKLGGFLVPRNVSDYVKNVTDDPRVEVPVIVSDDVDRISIIVQAA